jgi:glycosyltransferase involved in cell wall biosynthesis
MKILQILPTLNEGGVERGCVDSNREYVKLGHTSVVMSAGGRLVDQILADGGKHVTFDVASKNILTVFARVFQMKKLLQEIAPDVIHARSRVPAWLVWFANKTLKIPFITTVHGFNSVNAYSRVMTYGDEVICASTFLIEHIKKHYHTRDEVIHLIPRGIDLEYFNGDTVDHEWCETFVKHYALENKKLLVQVARVTGWKDQATVIKAFLEVRKTHDDLKLLLVGGVDTTREGYYTELLKLVETSPYKEDVIFTGSQSHIKEIFSLATLNISASTKPETFGRANVEGMVMGVPLLASRIGAAFDYIREGETGFFFECGDEKELATLIDNALKYPFDKAQISSFAKTHFSLRQMIEKTVDVYTKLLSKVG